MNEVRAVNSLMYNGNENLSIFERQPHENIIEILSFLDRDNLVNCSKINKIFYQITGERKLWRLFVNIFGIPEDINCMVATIEKIKYLKESLSIATDSLDENVIIASDYPYYLAEAVNFSSPPSKIFKKNKLSAYKEKIEVGVSSSLLLYQVGICTLQKAKEFAVAVNNKCHSNYGMESLCNVLIQEKKYQNADQLLKLIEKSDPSLNKARQFYWFSKIEDHCKKGEFDDAFDLYSSQIVSNFVKINSKYFYLPGNNESKLESSILKAKRFDLFEKKIDFYSSSMFKSILISKYLHSLVKTRDKPKIKEAIIKYGSELISSYRESLNLTGVYDENFKKDSNQDYILNLIEAYAEIGETNPMWEIITISRGSLDYLRCLNIVYDTLKDCNSEEAQKVEYYIQKELERPVRFELFEEKIDDCDPGYRKNFKLVYYLKELVKIHDKQRIIDFLVKYKGVLKVVDIIERHSQIAAYAELGMIDEIWDIITTYRNSQEFSERNFLWCLRKACEELKQHYYILEAEKIESLIEGYIYIESKYEDKL